MSRSVNSTVQSVPVRTLEQVRPTSKPPLKVESAAVPSSDQIGPIARRAVVKHYGTVKEAAYQLGEGKGLPALDPSLLMRELEAGKLGRLDVDPAAVAAVAMALTDAFAELTSPKAQARAAIRDIRRRCDEIEQFLEWAS